VWRDGHHGEAALLVSCYQRSLALAEEHGLASVAFPSISTGAYGFPMELAARIAVRETALFLESHTMPREVILVCYGARAFQIHRAAIEEWDRGGTSGTDRPRDQPAG
jgi:O-acetyl-ADP-ribose deacetylase (regulator of RNase III)